MGTYTFEITTASHDHIKQMAARHPAPDRSIDVSGAEPDPSRHDRVYAQARHNAAAVRRITVAAADDDDAFNAAFAMAMATCGDGMVTSAVMVDFPI